MNKYLLQKFINGKCSDEEVRQVLKWYYSPEAKTHYSNQINHIVEEYGRGISGGASKEHIFKAVVDKINFEKSAAYQIAAPQRSSKPYPFLKIAATISLLILFSFLFFKQPFEDRRPEATTEVEWIEKATTIGQKSTVYLSDGSKITLNAKSKIKFPQTFSDATRNLWLEGEAFFEVAHDPDRPFIVHTNELQTTVLGTSFNISNYPAERLVKVSLASGKIRINNLIEQMPDFEYLLNPGEGIVFNRENKAVKEVRFSRLEELSWKDGILYFKDADFYQIVEELETWYGVEIQVAGMKQTDQNKLFTGEYDNESLQNVLEGLSFAKNFDFSIEHDVVLIKFR